MADLRKPKNQDIPIQPLPGEISWSGPTPNTIWAGVSELVEEGSRCRIAIVIRNLTYLLDCVSHELEECASRDPTELSREIISQLQNYSTKYKEKFIGAGLPESLVLKCPGLCSQLWLELDIVPLVLRHEPRARTAQDRGQVATFWGWERKTLDEQADSMARKCIRSFGIGHVIHTRISRDNLVEVDGDFMARLANKQDYERTVEPRSWAIAQQYARELREKQVKVAFFSLTFHSKPDVHTRHALSCSSCYNPSCPGAGSCGTLYSISDLIVTYAQQSDQMPPPPLNAATSVPISQLLSAEQAPIDESDDDEDNWETKLAITATECVYRFRDVQLCAPPFPFRQRWDMEARQVIGERKNRGHKRKKIEYEEYDEEEYYEYNQYNEYFNQEEFDEDMQKMHEDLHRMHNDLQRMHNDMAAAPATVAAANTSAPPAKRRKKAMRKRKQGRAAAGEGVAGSPAGNSA
ncbi:hypothetical protein CNMCM5793_006107 [Aspergillus hiratsukae]|uniref:Uncharacterized protein n=1 Tax=Aspergillus hiratsukae TaxID=1194566 RepID=A0A8H6U9N7_9EURO|nr:hypothetical protein CNMCM5793_006107 [Aspergillus hiratsukae]KAF7167278.1 hypothetical protein CNMCM6106_002881 [Aspergillus hiratsukae]